MRRIAFPLMLASVGLMAVACDQEGTAGVAAPEPAHFAQLDAPKLKVDQSNLVSDQLGLSNGLYGQTYVPKEDNLARVELLLIVNQVPPTGLQTTVGLYTEITQPPIATASAFVAAPAPGELERTITYDFDPPLPLDKKAAYTIGWHGPGLSWEFAYGDPYPDGQVVLTDGTPLNPIADFVFTTYSLKK